MCVCVCVCTLLLLSSLSSSYLQFIMLMEIKHITQYMPDLMQKRFGCSQLWPVQPVCSQNWAGAFILVQVPTSNSVPFFKRRPRSYCTKPAQIWSEWPGQVLAKHILSRSKPVCKNHQAQFLVKCGQPSTSFPLSGSIEFWIILCKTSLDLILFWLTVLGFGPNGSGP